MIHRNRFAVVVARRKQRKREARRATVKAELARRDQEVAAHGDPAHLQHRRLLEQFRSELAAGKVKLPKYRSNAASRVKVCVRKRPLLDAQKEEREADVLSTVDQHTLLCHEPRTGVDGRQTLDNQPFLFDAVFGDESSGADVYGRAVGGEMEELLEPIFSSSGKGRVDNPRLTVFAYGQTGSGKTYTMSALTEAVLGRLLDAAAGVCATGRKASLSLSYYEIYMAKPYDLLSGHAACKMQEDAGGQCHITGLREVSCTRHLFTYSYSAFAMKRF